MSTIRIDQDHNKLLEKILAYLSLRGQKVNKKEFIGKLIENASFIEGVNMQEECPLEKDRAWINLKKTYSLGITNLSEKVDEYLYKLDGE